MSRIAEVARCEAVKSLGAVPAGCGFDGAIPHAPARGPVEVFYPREVVQTEAGNFRFDSWMQGRPADNGSACVSMACA